jgi:predicted cobalt transporter CbtA
MAKKKISGLPAGSALNGTELVPIVQTGTTKRITTQDIANLGNASGVEGSGTINTLPKFTASSTIGDSKFFDDGTNQGTETTTAVNRFIMSANASIAKIFSFRSGNLPRWAFRVDGTESGANAGADLAIRRYNDAGTFIDSPMSFDRSDGTASILKDATINGVRVGRGAGNDASNTAVGFESAYSNTSGNEITAIGYQALRANTTGQYNTALGNLSLFANTTGIKNTAIGRRSMQDNTTGNDNVSIGMDSLYFNTTGSNNTSIGYASLAYNITGSNNTAIGRFSLFNNTASNNTAVGFEAAYSNTTASAITAIGMNSLRLLTTGIQNTAVGYDSLRATTTGSSNVVLGYLCGYDNTTGSSNTAIGSGCETGNFSGSIVIGRDASATASNQFVVGSTGHNAGAVATEVLVSDRSWSVRINGVAYKILMKS